jgi:hypothetical protein
MMRSRFSFGVMSFLESRERISGIFSLSVVLSVLAACGLTSSVILSASVLSTMSACESVRPLKSE